VLRVLGNLLDLQGFEYQGSEQVRDELKATHEAAARGAPAGAFVATAAAGVEPLRDVPMYQVDAVLRRSLPLQQTRAGQAAVVEYAP
jgi:NADH-quinone oxidoreductase subunit G